MFPELRGVQQKRVADSAAAHAAAAMTCGTAHVSDKQPKKAAFDWFASSSSLIGAYLRRWRDGLWIHSGARALNILYVHAKRYHNFTLDAFGP